MQTERDEKIERLFYILPVITAALLLAMAILFFISPVSAATPIPPGLGMDDEFIEQVTALNYNVIPGLAVAGMEVRVPYGTSLTFVINPGTSSTATGTIGYTGDTTSSDHPITIGADSNTFHMPLDPLHAAWLHRIGVAQNGTGERGYYVSTDLTVYIGAMAYTQIVNATPIVAFTISSNKPVDLRVITESYDKAATDMQPGIGSDLLGSVWEWLNKLPKLVQDVVIFSLEAGGYLFEIAKTLFTWTKFFFWDNLLMTVALYMTLTMAFAARASRGNMAIFLRRWFKDQVGFFNFIVDIWQKLIWLLNSFVNIFK